MIIEEKLLFVVFTCWEVSFVIWTGDWSCSVVFPLMQLLVLKQRREETLNLAEHQRNTSCKESKALATCVCSDVVMQKEDDIIASVTTVQWYVKCVVQ